MTALGQALHVWRGQAESPAWNMAADELLLSNAAALGQAVLRLYSWNQAAASFGYFQRHAEVSGWTDLTPLIRRPTGGGLVRHDEHEWTYSLTFPPGHPWWHLKAEESYYHAHDWVRRAFGRCSLVAELCPETRLAGPGQCFVGAEKNDLLFCGNKIAGAAQRRNRKGLLIQGSVQAKTTGVSREDWEKAMLSEDEYREWQPPDTFADETKRLAKRKYESDSHNRKR